MTREIKFRAWQTHHKEMYQPLVGYIEFPDIVVGFDDGDLRLEGEKNVILMQFTGLKDKNSKEIYESDLFKTDYGQIYEIVYYRNGFYLKDGLHSQFDEEKGEVIGNVYEN